LALKDAEQQSFHIKSLIFDRTYDSYLIYWIDPAKWNNYAKEN